MKKCLGFLAASFLVLGMSACSEDFDVAAPYKDITVVYGLLNYGDTVQYIRVQKAFLDQNRSALEMAKTPDSNFYRNIEVQMKTIQNGAVTATETLDRVDMNAYGFPKEPGTFFSAPNYGYRYARKLIADATYRLVIINKETGNTDSADTRIIDTARTTFTVNELNEVTRKDFTIDFNANSPNTLFKLSLGSQTVPNAAYFEGYIRFNYVNVENGVQQDTFFVWNFASTTGNALTVPTAEFYTTFRAFIPVSRNGQERLLDSAEVYVWAADQNYYNYMLNNRSLGGLTADQIRPNYTTIRGKDVLGVFGSRARRVRYNVPIGNLSLDSLIHNRFTKDIGFTGRSDH